MSKGKHSHDASSAGAAFKGDYAQWIRKVMTAPDRGQLNLIGSSFDEPLHLLEDTIKRGFCDGLPEAYKSVFVNGNPLVQQLLCKHYRIEPQQLLCTTGATTSLGLIYRTFTQPGDHVLIERPALDVFAVLAEERQLAVDWIERPADLNFQVNLDSLRRHIRPETKLIVLSNLHNPSGALLADADIKDIAAIAAENDCLVVMDEVYIGYAQNMDKENSGVCVTSAHLAPNIIAINSLTKTHGLNSLRCGWIITQPDTLRELRRFSDSHEFSVSKLSHAVAGLVLQEESVYTEYRNKVMAKVKPIIDFYMNALVRDGLINDFIPEYGCMYFPVITGMDDTQPLTEWLEKEKKVIVAPGVFFGLPSAVRLGLPEHNEDLTVALERFTSGVREYLS